MNHSDYKYPKKREKLGSDSASRSLSCDDVIKDGQSTSDNQSAVEFGSGLVRFVFENAEKLFDRLRLTMHEKQGGKDMNSFDDQIVAIKDESSER